MQMTHTDFSHSTALRASLKRGLARQALTAAERESADFPALFVLAAGLRPNSKGLERMATRLGTQRGVTRVALTSCRKSLSFTARAIRQVEARVQGETAFRGWDGGARIVEGDDEFYSASIAGVWAGGHDGMRLEPDWGLSTDVVPAIPIFSARTFLSPTEMRPTVYLRWKDDPNCQIL